MGKELKAEEIASGKSHTENCVQSIPEKSRRVVWLGRENKKVHGRIRHQET